jgi:hypothetical protein
MQVHASELRVPFGRCLILQTIILPDYLCIFEIHLNVMKQFIISSLFLIGVLSFPSCNSSDDDAVSVNDLLGTYVGAMNVQNPSFSNAQYTVVVSKVSGNTVRISPSGSVGTEWTATLTNIAGVYTCLGCVTQNQITLTRVSGVYNLSYNYDSNNEQFGGVKQ